MSSQQPNGGRTRLNPMELKRQRMAKRLRSQIADPSSGRTDDSANKMEDKTVPIGTHARDNASGNVSNSSIVGKLLDAKLSTIYTNSRMDRPAKHRIADFPTSFQTYDVLPLDWTLKNKLICLTPFRFPPRSSGAASARLFRRFVESSPLSVLPNDVTASPCDQWHYALHQFVHPATPGMSHGVDGPHVPVDDEFTTQRLRTWQEACRNLYYTFHHNSDHDAFYVVTAQSVVCFYRTSLQTSKTAPDADCSTRNSLRSLFRQYLPNQNASSKADTIPDGKSKLHSVRQHISVVISHTTTTLRRDLLAAGVQFHVPFASAEATTPLDPNAIDPMHASIRGLDTMLLIHGPCNVHGVFDLLLNQPGLLAASTDVPLLCARFPFQHAGIVPLQVSPCGQVAGPTPMFKTEVAGCILPHTVHLITNALRCGALANMASSFQVVLEPWSASVRLNVCGWDRDLHDSTNLSSATWWHQADEQEAVKRRMHVIQWSPQTGYQVTIEK